MKSVQKVMKKGEMSDSKAKSGPYIAPFMPWVNPQKIYQHNDWSSWKTWSGLKPCEQANHRAQSVTNSPNRCGDCDTFQGPMKKFSVQIFAGSIQELNKIKKKKPCFSFVT